jgi:hypothetical protein
MELNPLDPRYIAKSKPVCNDCDQRATWRLMLDESDPTDFVEFCAAHAPVAPHDITDG